MNKPIPVTIALDERAAQLLSDTLSPCFLPDQRERFEWILPSETLNEDTADIDFLGTSFQWCATASDALLLKAYKEARGIEVALLWDLAALDGDVSGYVLCLRESYR